MKIYLVDFENVKSKGLDGIDKLCETDSVIIFFSENSDTLSFEMHQKVLSSKADIEYFKVCVGGKNALDFPARIYGRKGDIHAYLRHQQRQGL